MPVPVNSTYAKKQLELEMDALDVEPDDSGDEDQGVITTATSSQISSQVTVSTIPPTTSTEILMSVANAAIIDTTPAVLSMPIINPGAEIQQPQTGREKSSLINLEHPNQQNVRPKAPAEETMSEATQIHLEKDSLPTPPVEVDEPPKRRSSSLQKVLSSEIVAKPSTQEPGDETTVSETFLDLLKVYDVDATLAEELTRPLSDYLSPLPDASPLLHQTNHSVEDEPALDLYASPLASLEGESNSFSDSSPSRIGKKRSNRDELEMKTNPDKEQILKRPKADYHSGSDKSQGFKIPLRPSQGQNRSRGREDRIVDTASDTAPRRGRDDDRRHGHRRSRPSYHPRHSPDRSHTMSHGFQGDELTPQQLRWLQRMPREWHR